MSSSNRNTLIPRGPNELKRWSGGLIRRGLDELQRYDSSGNLTPVEGINEEKADVLEQTPTQIYPTVNSADKPVSPTREEMLNDPEILEIITDLGVEYYNAGITDKAQWHASIYAEMEGIVEGLGADLEPLLPMTWYSISGDEDGYLGGIGGVYGANAEEGIAGPEAGGLPNDGGATGGAYGGIQPNPVEGPGGLGETPEISGGEIQPGEIGIPGGQGEGIESPTGGGAGRSRIISVSRAE